MAGVIVWEWQNEFGFWRPYSPYIVAYIESNSSSAKPLKLGDVDKSLSLYTLDVQNFVQTRTDTGIFYSLFIFFFFCYFLTSLNMRIHLYLSNTSKSVRV